MKFLLGLVALLCLVFYSGCSARTHHSYTRTGNAQGWSAEPSVPDYNYQNYDYIHEEYPAYNPPTRSEAAFESDEVFRLHDTKLHDGTRHSAPESILENEVKSTDSIGRSAAQRMAAQRRTTTTMRPYASGRSVAQRLSARSKSFSRSTRQRRNAYAAPGKRSVAQRRSRFMRSKPRIYPGGSRTIKTSSRMG